MIELKNVALRSGSFFLSEVSFLIPSGVYAVLMGKTGVGKTTILESICGLRKITSGEIHIDSIDVTDWLPGDRQIGYVPQDLALFPTMTVREHLEFALLLRKESRTAINQRVDEMSEVLGIRSLMNRGIQGLSGGERQRVALGRALTMRPSILLLDEPLSALDENTRIEMQALLAKIKSATGVTTLHVTHNQQEAETLADMTLRLERELEISRVTVL